MIKATVKEVKLLEDKLKITSGILNLRLFARPSDCSGCATLQTFSTLPCSR